MRLSQKNNDDPSCNLMNLKFGMDAANLSINSINDLPLRPDAASPHFDSLPMYKIEKSLENLKTPDQKWDLDRVKCEILNRLPIDLDYDDWLTVGMVLHFQFAGAQEACMAFDDFSLLRPKYPQGNEQSIEQKWKSFGKGDKNNRTIGTLLRMRDEYEKKTRYESKLDHGMPLFSRLVDAQKELKEVNWQVENMVKQGELVMISAM